MNKKLVQDVRSGTETEDNPADGGGAKSPACSCLVSMGGCPEKEEEEESFVGSNHGLSLALCWVHIMIA